MLPDSQGGAPRVVVTDRAQYRAFYSFDMQAGFQFLKGLKEDKSRQFTTSPLALPDGSTVTGMRTGFLWKTRPDLEEGPRIVTAGMLTATPTLHKDGNSFMTVSRDGAVHKVTGLSPVTQILTGGRSIASAASSCTHVFVATTSGVMTLDANNMNTIANLTGISGAGFSSPVIGPAGQVYIMAGQNLLVFNGPPASDGSTACDVIP
jgi:hypothetical protein